MVKKTLKIPLHVGIIMDGNGRWAKKRLLPRVMGHREGVKTVKRIVEHAANMGIKYLSLFAFSTENWFRPEEEVSTLMGLLDEYLDSEMRNIVEKGISLRVSGDISKLREATKTKLMDIIEASKNNRRMVLNLALNYGGRDELLKAASDLARDFASGKIAESELGLLFKNYLYNPDVPDIDLLIRTSGEIRISNFMLWRLAYSELYFTKVLWPDFSEKDFDEAIEDYNRRIRRFGKTDEQILNQ
ncbi:isoprenyl transferase [Calditerrivibrio nitroreducens]|uniref:Isoprenyl transferase n=1 Tax=Calditerrivibrio nitroreducens (strain DSM 19672 / NBRC 101217 / Yu37-1) TaxID=768670 RepID=E4THG0_CALNY|nr:isoprenyl transferase [Calditerrivibrio nitroreducens]ADR19895.1 Undecaprenyl pyrophosphate synthetase [Calditerrivibrio nitroreducens DSM 19672]